jgi:uncharacterized membrane protein YsdA (DUF1294 family)
MTTLLVILAVLNVVSFALFGIDKWKAGRGAWRISESTLILSGAICGTIGAWLGVVVFRHKTRKRSFLVQLGAASLLDAAVLFVVTALI